MSAVGIETQNTLYLFSDGQYQRIPLRGERTPGEQFQTILASGTLDDGVWIDMKGVDLGEHPAFPGEVALRIITGPSPWEYVITTPVTDPEAAKAMIEDETWR